MNIQKNNMTKEELKKELKNIGDVSVQLFKKDGEISPALFVYHILDDGKEKKKLSCTVCPIKDIQHRREIMFLLGRLFLKEKRFKRVDAIVFVSEAWVSKYKSNKDAEKNKMS